MRLIDAEPIEKYIENGLNEKDHAKRFGYDAIKIMTEIHYAPTITPPPVTPPPNDPLTLEQLREMDGEPVWVQCLSNEDYSGWIIADLCFNGVDTKYFYAYFYYYGEEWLAYRRKPDGGTYDN